MQIYEVISILLIISFFSWRISKFVYKMKHKLPIGECACCQKRMRKAFESYKKKYKKDS